ncbi:flagellar basal body L-ring protein FlgH [Poriferisphaera sp. WC338]|uniref:flagellar basal body L-ring protein FlgH n=1 Tax=Poriferisphaera sp. WC338 TaxID=3425129 RepID=UPI003D819780
MKKMRWIIFVLIACMAGVAYGQSSSLYMQESDELTVKRPYFRDPSGVVRKLSPSIARSSFIAVELPEMRQFAKHDLVTIIIQESASADFSSSLETNKEVKVNGSITDFPRFDLAKLIQFQLQPNNITNPVKVGVDFKNEFTGDGDLSRTEKLTGRIQARIIDVKPNGTLVLEARKYTQVDKESVTMILTGTCRAEDITAANTILSYQLEGLHLVKQHEGELAKSAKKGILTKVVEFLFNF